MTQHKYEWTPRLPNSFERVGAGVWTTTMLFAGVNAFAGWHVFDGYDGAVTGLLALVGLLLLRFLPTVKRT